MSLVVRSEKIHKSQLLEDAFQAFNQVSQHLTDSYQQLEQQVVVLSEALSQSNSEKIQYLSDKEALANQLEGLIEVIPGAVIVLDAKQNVVKANACARNWLNDDIVGQNWPLARANFLNSHDQLSDQLSLENGKIVALSITDLSGRSGKVVLLSDITHQQELNQQLEHKKKLAEMGEFSASLAHQIRTPLASALLYASQLSSDALGADAQQKFATKLLDRLRVLNSQVTDMLNYSHSGDFVKQPVSLKLFINGLRNLYQDKSVGFDISDIDETVQLYISKEALVGAISNLLDNALDATNSSGFVLCSIKISEINSLRIIVKDQGVGLSEDQQKRIFEPFYTNKTNGTGLGLAVVRNVVNAHVGEVTCNSRLGVGTTMDVRLPVVMSSSMKQSNRSL